MAIPTFSEKLHDLFFQICTEFFSIIKQWTGGTVQQSRMGSACHVLTSCSYQDTAASRGMDSHELESLNTRSKPFGIRRGWAIIEDKTPDTRFHRTYHSESPWTQVHKDEYFTFGRWIGGSESPIEFIPKSPNCHNQGIVDWCNFLELHLFWCTASRI
jgi:hypothetical protein